jgi:hypothetical protein
MNARKIWTELFQKPAGRLVLFLLVGAIFLAFILMRRTPQPKPDNTPVASQATQAKSYSFKEDIQPPSRTEATPPPRESDKIARATPTPKPPSPIPQTIFATREQSVSQWFLPYGRLLRCELVNTVDSTNIDTPIIGLVIEDIWNEGRLIIPAGTEVHGVAQKSPVRERIGSDRQWFLVFQDGSELPISGSVLDYAPTNSDSWAESDGSAGLRGFVVKSDKYAEAKAILAAMISTGAGAFPETTTLISPLGGATQLNNGGIDSAFSAGLQAGGQLYSKRQNRAMKERIDALQKNESAIQSLQSEVERLKKELDSRKESAPVEDENASDDFSLWRPAPQHMEDEISDPGEIVLFPRSDADSQAFLVSQMRLNDELAKALDTLERRRLVNLLWPLFPSRAYLALNTNNTP